MKELKTIIAKEYIRNLDLFIYMLINGFFLVVILLPYTTVSYHVKVIMAVLMYCINTFLMYEMIKFSSALNMKVYELIEELKTKKNNKNGKI